MLTVLLLSLAGPVHAQARTLNVFAAALLKESFTSIASSYETAHPGVTVNLNFSGSQTLATKINNGAPADVFASAAAMNLGDSVFDKGSYRVFIQNKLEIAVRKGLAESGRSSISPG